jgi:hypothetical protein
LALEHDRRRAHLTWTRRPLTFQAAVFASRWPSCQVCRTSAGVR